LERHPQQKRTKKSELGKDAALLLRQTSATGGDLTRCPGCHWIDYESKDGGRIPVLVGAMTLEDGGQQGVDFVSDLAVRKRTQETLRQMEGNLAHMNRVSMMGELTASLVHEIAQPIAAASNNAAAALIFLDAQRPDLREVREALICIAGDANRAGLILDRVRDQIKKSPLQRKRIDLREAINEVIELSRSAIIKYQVSVQTSLTRGEYVVDGDRVQLQQVVLNLILNAVEAMGTLPDARRELSISAGSSGTSILVTVRDSGPGIDPENAERIFQPFYTTKSSGLGMGLSICRSIIDTHGGRLWASPNTPRGAVFNFTLPGVKPPEHAPVPGMGKPS
jgi:C4-dicarboxylate-specific signal transduction histidine kinase